MGHDAENGGRGFEGLDNNPNKRLIRVIGGTLENAKFDGEFESGVKI